MKTLPAELQAALDKYIQNPFESRQDISLEILDIAINAMTASFAYGIMTGCALASAAENKPMLSRFPTGSYGNPIINELLTIATPYEPEIAKFFKEDMGL